MGCPLHVCHHVEHAQSISLCAATAQRPEILSDKQLTSKAAGDKEALDASCRFPCVLLGPPGWQEALPQAFLLPGRRPLAYSVPHLAF